MEGVTINQTPKERRPGGRAIWLAAVAVAVLAGVAVPYGLLADSEYVMAVVLFWMFFGVVVVGLIVLGVMRWRDGV